MISQKTLNFIKDLEKEGSSFKDEVVTTFDQYFESEKE